MACLSIMACWFRVWGYVRLSLKVRWCHYNQRQYWHCFPIWHCSRADISFSSQLSLSFNLIPSNLPHTLGFYGHCRESPRHEALGRPGLPKCEFRTLRTRLDHERGNRSGLVFLWMYMSKHGSQLPLMFLFDLCVRLRNRIKFVLCRN